MCYKLVVARIIVYIAKCRENSIFVKFIINYISLLFRNGKRSTPFQGRTKISCMIIVEFMSLTEDDKRYVERRVERTIPGLSGTKYPQKSMQMSVVQTNANKSTQVFTYNSIEESGTLQPN